MSARIATDSAEPLEIAGPAGRIEGALAAADPPPRRVLAIVCHPLPT